MSSLSVVVVSGRRRSFLPRKSGGRLFGGVGSWFRLGRVGLVVGLGLFLAGWAGCTRPCPTLLRGDGGADAQPWMDDVPWVDAWVDPDADVDSAVPLCTPAYDACRITFGPLEVSAGESQDPDVAFGNDRILVTYLDYSGDGGVTLVAYDRMGNRLFEEKDLGGLNGSFIAWNADLGVGLVGSDCGVRWLGSDGRPVGRFQEVWLFGEQCAPQVAPVSGGFAVLAVAHGYIDPGQPPIGAVFLGPTPEPFQWELALDTDKPWWPFKSALDEQGWGRYFASTVWSDYGADSATFSVGDGSLTQLGLVPPNSDAMVVAGAVYDGSLYLVWRAYGSSDSWLERVEPHELWPLSLGSGWESVALMHVGDDLVLLAEVTGGQDRGLVMSRLDLSRDGDPETDRRVLVPGDAGWLLQATETPGHGFAAVWGGNGGPIELIHVDCCPVR